MLKLDPAPMMGVRQTAQEAPMDLALNPTRLTGGPQPVRRGATATSGDSFAPSAAPDASLAAAAQLRTLAGNRMLSQIPTSLLPMGTSKYHAKAKIWIFTKDLGEATANRTDSEIDIHTTKGDATITSDPQNQNMVDVSVPGSSQKYEATLQQQDGGIVATTTDGKTVTVKPDGSDVDITASGFPQVPSSAVIILSPE
ncbi:MAG: hypothetical protein ACYCW6_06575 [Candidatus Xenobia bacterium]